MWIIIILLIVAIISVVVFKFVLKPKEESISSEKEDAFLDIKMKSNIIKDYEESEEINRQPLKRPLRPRNSSLDDDIISVNPPKEEIEEVKEIDEDKKIEADNEVLDLDDLFKTISITTEGEDENFDFGLRSKNDDR